MLRAKLLNRSGWKRLKAFTSSIPAMVLMTVCCQSAIGNAQQGTDSNPVTSNNAIRALPIVNKHPKNTTGEDASTSTKTNQQPQHRVSVAPQGGELGKGTGAATPLICFVGEVSGEDCYPVHHVRTNYGVVCDPDRSSICSDSYRDPNMFCADKNGRWHHCKIDGTPEPDHPAFRFARCREDSTGCFFEFDAARCQAACDRPPWQIPVPKELR